MAQQSRLIEKNLTGVLEAAWCGNPASDKLALLIEQRVRALGKKAVSSQEIRDIVLEELKEADKTAYRFYRWYQKGKDRC